MDLKQALKGNDKDIITMYAQIAYNELGAAHLKELFDDSGHTFYVINDIVYVLSLS